MNRLWLWIPSLSLSGWCWETAVTGDGCLPIWGSLAPHPPLPAEGKCSLWTSIFCVRWDQKVNCLWGIWAVWAQPVREGQDDDNDISFTVKLTARSHFPPLSAEVKTEIQHFIWNKVTPSISLKFWIIWWGFNYNSWDIKSFLDKSMNE